MYERTYGSNYEATKEIYDTSVLAKLIRADIKAAVKAGDLPKATYSVQTRKYAGGSAIDIELRDLEGAWVAEDMTKCPSNSTCREGDHYSHRGCEGAEHLSDEAALAKIILSQIQNSYNFDGSETQVDYWDVRFYGHVQVESKWSADWRARDKAAKDAKKARVVSS